MGTQHRIDVIDAFRGLSILAVMAFHYLWYWQGRLHYEYAYSDLFRLGAYGVHVFFVISGLVITMTLLRSRGPVDFGVKRFARIWPPLLIAASLTFLLLQAAPKDFQTTGLGYLGSITLTYNELHLKPVDGAYWSLEVESKFYVYVAVAYWLLKDRFWIGLLVLATIAGVLEKAHANWLSYALLGRFWPYFLLGVGAWLARFEKRPREGSILILAAGALFVLNHPDLLASIFVLVGSGAMLTLLVWCPSLHVPGLAALGRWSYSLYLLHQMLGVFLISLIPGPDWLRVGATVITITAGAWAMYRFVELPAQRLVLDTYRKLPLLNRAA